MRVAVQMDHPNSLNTSGDSTIALLEVAARRGCDCYYYHPSQLAVIGGEVVAHEAQYIETAEPWCRLAEPATLKLSEMDVVLIRQDPPYDMDYFTATYLLDQLPDSVSVYNNSAYLRNKPEKLAILDYPDAIPPTIVSRSEADILAFLDTHQQIVIKPLYGFGGRSIYRFKQGDSNLLTLLEHFREDSGEPLMVQAFLPEVKDQDVRVILIHGKVEAAVGRVPAEGEIRANFRVGGTAKAVELNTTQQAICDRVGEHLKAQGVLFAGLDLIGDYLTEINVTSPTGIRAAQQLYDTDPAEAFWDAVEAR